MLTQKYLRCGGTLEVLKDKLDIEVTEHPELPLVILNYSQIDSPRYHPIVRECRGLILEKGSWDIVCRSFPRFFNHGECRSDDERFNWDEPQATTKEDGSLLHLWFYEGRWRVSTRRSFAGGLMHPSIDLTWEQCFWSAIDQAQVGLLHPAFTYVFEMCSPFNKIVRRYPSPMLFLLTVFHNESGREIDDLTCLAAAQGLKVKRPASYEFSSADEVKRTLESHPDPTFEGFVLKDKNGRRLKIKNQKYVALHHLKGEGDNLFHPKYLLPFVLAENGEENELLTYFEEARPFYEKVKAQVDQMKASMMTLWEKTKGMVEQREFASWVKDHPLSTVLFKARKEGREPLVVLKECENVLLKRVMGA